jgi:hypothetical protein
MYPFVFNTPSSILMICLDWPEDKCQGVFVQQLANKLMQAFNKGLDYLDIVLVINNGNASVDTKTVLQEVRSHLRGVANSIEAEEKRLLPDLQALAKTNIEFYDQEKLRNQIRLRFAIERFLSPAYESHSKCNGLDVVIEFLGFK